MVFKRINSFGFRAILIFWGIESTLQILKIFQIKSFLLVYGAVKTTINDQGVVWVYGKGHLVALPKEVCLLTEGPELQCLASLIIKHLTLRTLPWVWFSKQSVGPFVMTRPQTAQ